MDVRRTPLQVRERPHVKRISRLIKSVSANRLSRNGIFAATQVVVVTASMFIVYRMIVAYAGIERFGIWSLLMALSTFIRVGDLSGAGALARFVAMTRYEGTSTPQTIHTVIITALTFNAILAVILFAASPLVFPLILEPGYFSDASALLPYALTAIVIGTLAGATSSAIDGLQRADQRSIAVMAGAISALGASWFLIPAFGIVGYGIGEICRHSVQFAISWLILRTHVPDVGWVPYRWNGSIFRTTFRYALMLNASSLMSTMIDPLSKLAFNHASGPAAVAFFELANRVIVQLRSLISAAAVPMVPALAEYPDARHPEPYGIMARSTSLVLWAAGFLSALSLVLTPIVSLLVVGSLDRTMIIINAVMTFGWSVNLLSLPYYLAGQAYGILRYNLAGHACVVGALLLGMAAGVPLFGWHALLAASIGGLVVGALVTTIGNGAELGLSDLLRKNSTGFLLTTLAIATTCTMAAVAAI